MKQITWLMFLLLIVSCQSNPPIVSEEINEPTSFEQLVTATVPIETIAEPTNFVPVSSDGRVGRKRSVAVSGPEQVVFDWTNDRCEDEHIPDIAARAFRDAQGRVQLWIGHYVNYRMIGPDLDNLVSDCTVLMRSDYDPAPSMFNDSEWLAAPYTEDGETIYGIVHNEYRGDTHTTSRPDQCPSGDRLTCLDTSVTMVISTDGGDSYQEIADPPGHMVATMPYRFNDEGVPSGLRQPSNIIKGEEGNFYVFTNISDYPEDPSQFPPQWVCVMRTNDLSDPSSWRYWDGDGFTGQFVDPYQETVGNDPQKCAPLDSYDLSGSLNESVTYNLGLERYIMVGVSFHPTADEPMWGFYYSLSDDLIHWTRRELIIELPIESTVNDSSTDLFYAYPSLIDPDSTSMNFDTTDKDAYLYLTRFNNGVTLDRDLVRFPIEITLPEYAVPGSWAFNIDGDAEGWLPENQLSDFVVQGGSLSMQATGDDPFMISPYITVPAEEYNRLGVRMKLSAGQPTGGQLFFVTETDSEWDEEKSLVFDVTVDGEFHDYILDMSLVDGWKGVVTQLRLDPVWSQGRIITIDMIAFIE